MSQFDEESLEALFEALLVPEPGAQAPEGLTAGLADPGHYTTEVDLEDDGTLVVAVRNGGEDHHGRWMAIQALYLVATMLEARQQKYLH